MPQLTQTEVWFLDEVIKSNRLLISKLSAYTQMTSDPQLRQLCQDCLHTHQRHFSMLASQIR
ncbi:MAG TPA: spore coat protein [Clostridiales bacterium]|nr:spore coat protein [Clostridiales bacterium]